MVPFGRFFDPGTVPSVVDENCVVSLDICIVSERSKGIYDTFACCCSIAKIGDIGVSKRIFEITNDCIGVWHCAFELALRGESRVPVDSDNKSENAGLYFAAG